MSTINVLKTVLTASDDGFSKTFVQAATSARELNKMLKEGEAVYKATRTPLENYEAEVAKLNRLLRDGGITQETFNRALKQADSILPQAARNTSVLSDAFGKLVPVFDPISLGLRAVGAAADVGAVAFNLMVDAVTSSIKKIDDLVDSAEKIGVATDALSALRYAAGFVGVEADALDNAVGKMNVNINKAADEGGKAAEAFEKLGLDAKELRAMGPEKAFMAIADAVKAIDDPMQRANAAQEAFGKSGRDLIPLLMQGAAAIKAQRDEAEMFGLVIDELDAAKVGVAATNFDKLAGAAEGAALAFTKAIAPALSLVADKLTISIKEIGSMDRAMHNFVGNITADIGRLLNALDMMKRANDAIVGMKLPDTETPLAGDRFVMEMIKAQQKANEDAKAAVRAARAARGGGPSDEPGNDGASALGNTPFDREAERLREQLRTPLEVLQDELTKFGDMFAAGSIDVETLNRALAKAEADYEKTLPMAKLPPGAGKMENNIPPPAGQRFNPSIAALEQGSAAAFSAINAARGGGAATGTAAESARKQLDVARRQQKLQEQIAANTARKPMVANIAG